MQTPQDVSAVKHQRCINERRATYPKNDPKNGDNILSRVLEYIFDVAGSGLSGRDLDAIVEHVEESYEVGIINNVEWSVQASGPERKEHAKSSIGVCSAMREHMHCASLGIELWSTSFDMTLEVAGGVVMVSAGQGDSGMAR